MQCPSRRLQTLVHTVSHGFHCATRREGNSPTFPLHLLVSLLEHRPSTDFQAAPGLTTVTCYALPPCNYDDEDDQKLFFPLEV